MIKYIHDFVFLLDLFFIYSFIGWIIEAISGLLHEHRFINRGFLIGPVIPIWGVGAILITLILKDSDGFFNLIVSSAFIGTFLEYVVNYLMEKLFKARWWDYSHYPFNINGRVWLGASLFFGIGGCLIIKLSNPFFINLLSILNYNVLYITTMTLFTILLIDICVSCNIISNLKITAYSIKKDCTEEVSKMVQTTLFEKSLSFRRLLKAFPNVKFLFIQKK